MAQDFFIYYSSALLALNIGFLLLLIGHVLRDNCFVHCNRTRISGNHTADGTKNWRTPSRCCSPCRDCTCCIFLFYCPSGWRSPQLERADSQLEVLLRSDSQGSIQ